MDRRKFFRLLGAGGLFGLLKAKAQTPPWDEDTFAPMKTLGDPLSEYGQRSPFEEGVVRYISPNLRTRNSGADFAPLEKLEGVITPNGLHFERHHGGCPRWTRLSTALLFTVWWKGP